MNKKLGLILLLILFTQFFIGCYEPEPSDKLSGEYDLYVDDNFTINTNGWNIDHFKTIQKALKKARQNDSIYVYNGHYNETLIINKTISLKGENAYQTIIDGNSKKNDVILIKGNGRLTICGFSIINSGFVGSYVYDIGGIDIRSSYNTIKNNIFINNTCGIYTRYADDNKIENNLFLNNIEYGTYLHTSSDENYFSDNIFKNNKYGLRIKGSKECIIYKNAFINNQNGLYLCCGSRYNVVYENIFCNNSNWDGLDHFENSWDTSIPPRWYQNNNTKKLDLTDGQMKGNFWGNFYTPHQGAFDNNSDGIIDKSYDIPNVDDNDNFPLIEPPLLVNNFISNEEIKKCFV